MDAGQDMMPYADVLQKSQATTNAKCLYALVVEGRCSCLCRCRQRDKVAEARRTKAANSNSGELRAPTEQCRLFATIVDLVYSNLSLSLNQQ
jgi:hypothetical protein